MKPETLSDRFELAAALKVLRRNVHVLAGCTVLGLGAGYFYDQAQIPLYTATSRIEANPQSARVLESLKLEGGGATTLRITSTTRERLRSRALAERVVSDLDLANDAAFLGRTPLGHAEPAREIADLIAPAEPRDVRSAVAKLRSGLVVSFVRNTGLLRIQFTHPDRAISARVANGVADSYLAMERDRLREAAEATRGTIERQLADAEAQLRESESTLLGFAAQTKLAIGANGEPLPEEGISALRRALAQATTERVAAERRLAQLDEDGAATLPEAFANGALMNARNVLSKLRAEYRMKRARMKPDFPAMLSLADRIRDFEDDVERELAVVGRAVRAQAHQVKTREARLHEEVKRAEAVLVSSRTAGIGYSAIKRKVEADRSRYATLAGKLSEVTVSAGLSTPSITIVDLAGVPTGPSNGNLPLHLLAGLLLFGGLGGAYATWREVSRDVFDTPADVANETGVAVVGAVPSVRFGRFAAHEGDAQSPLRESYRYLRNKLRADVLAKPGCVLLVAGVGRGAGASVTSRRLALDLAAMDRRVLLVDADRLGGRQHRAFGVSNDLGLSELLAWSKGLNVPGCFHSIGETGVTLLPAGAGATDAEGADRIASERMERVLAILRKSFDTIIVDAAPVLSRADASALSTYADATLLVVRSDRTRRSDLHAALKHLEGSGAAIAGALFTRYERRAFQRAEPRHRDRFEVLRELVTGTEVEGPSNPVHDLRAAAGRSFGARKVA